MSWCGCRKRKNEVGECVLTVLPLRRTLKTSIPSSSSELDAISCRSQERLNQRAYS